VVRNGWYNIDEKPNNYSIDKACSETYVMDTAVTNQNALGV
jgi:hypothetical protein